MGKNNVFSTVNNGMPETTKDDGSHNTDIRMKTVQIDNVPDGGWGWVITVTAFISGFVMDGVVFSFGVFFDDILSEFDASKGQVAWIVSVLIGTASVMGIVTGALMSMFGYRAVAMVGAGIAAVALFLSSFSMSVTQMILIYGLVGGIGFGLLFLPPLVAVGHYFEKKRSLATGIALCGNGIGGFVYPPMSEFLIERYTWRGALWIISAIVLNCIPVSYLLRPLRQSTKEENRKPCFKQCDISSMFNCEILKSPTLLIYSFATILCCFSYFIPATYLPIYVQDKGMTSQDGAWLVAIIGIANTASRIAMGWMADRPWTNVIVMNSFMLIIGGVATVFVTLYKHFLVLAVYCAVIGATMGTFITLSSIIMVELFGIDSLTSTFGLTVMCRGLGAFVGPPISGFLSDVSGSYKGTFYLAGALITLSGVICFPLNQISRCEKRRKYDNYFVD